jgi:hypothetical protein
VVNCDEVIGATEYLMAETRCLISRCHHNHVPLHLSVQQCFTNVSP